MRKIGRRFSSRTFPLYGRPAANVMDPGYFKSSYPFIDLMKSSTINWSVSTYTDANGWIASLPNATSVSIDVFFAMETTYGYIKPGTYKVTCSSGCAINVSDIWGSGADVSSITGNGSTTLVTFVAGAVAHVPGAVWSGVRVSLTNSTGSPVNVTDLKVFHVDHETLLNAGEIFNPDFLEDLAHVREVRVMDWTAINGSNTCRVSHLHPESYRTWSVQTKSNNRLSHVPYSVCAKLAQKLGCVLGVTVPICSEEFTFAVDTTTDIFTTNYVAGWAENQQIMFTNTESGPPPGLTNYVRYYAVNVTNGASNTTFQVSLTSGGGAVGITGGNIASRYGLTGVYDPAELYDAIAAECYAAAPNIVVKPEASNELWNTQFTQWRQNAYAMGFLATGVAGSAAPSGAAYASLKVWKAFGDYYPRNQIDRVFCGQASFFNNLGSAFDYVDPGVIQAGQTMAQLVDTYATAPYLYMRSSGTAPGFGSDVSMATLISEGGITNPDSYLDAYFANGIAFAAYYADANKTAARAKNAGIKLSTYECGQHISFSGLSSSANNKLMMDRIKGYLDSAAGATLYENYHAAVFAPNELILFNHYMMACKYSSSNTGGEQWGLKFAQGADNDTPRSTWFKALR